MKFTLFSGPEKSPTRFYGCNEDGSKYSVGITVGDLRDRLSRLKDSDEVCVAVCPKKYWNGGGFCGKVQEVEIGAEGQIWLKASVVDPSQE